ncbi:hypothetical protein Dsin_022304 [Dipteronia sinensis]|uniref:MULE transposase domain-containing protein n=1 Tax=Dipteronia sinensis TaxID=43782 RepID=A0AAE0A1C1_9ROSI|nr:hypothetical protein Dsin_022304 [Dipteronia sinensis]
MVVFYDGVFDKSNGKTEYIGGKCEIVTDCDVIPILNFYALARRFGYHKDYDAWYVVPGLGLEDGLVKIITNDNVEQMNHALNPDRRVDVYIQGTRVEHDESGPSNVNQFENVEAEEAEHGEWTNYVEEPEQSDMEDDYLEAYSDSGSENEDFDDDFVEPEYQQEEELEVVEHNNAFVVDGEEQNEGENDEQENSGFEYDESQFDDEQKTALNELRKLDRKRDLKKTKVFNSNFEFFDENSNLRNINLRVGQGFSTGKVFKDAVKEYAIKKGRSILFPCNEPKRVQGVCKMREHGCPWYTKAIKPGGNFNFGDFIGKVRKDYILAPSRSQVYRAKNKVGEIIQGSLYEQYGKLRDYTEEFKKSNPDNSYYPIAYVVVERESYVTWKWFLEFLKIDLNLNQPFSITFMTDKQKGLIEAINELWRDSEHRFCVRHMYANFKKKFKGDLIRNKVWQAAKASTKKSGRISWRK